MLTHEACRRRRSRIAIWLTAAGLVAIAAYLSPREWRYAKVRYLEQQCRALKLNNATVVYEEDPAKITGLLGKADYKRAIGYFHPNDIPAIFWPAAVDRYLGEIGVQTAGPPGKAGLCLFAEMSTPAGERRLVVVEFQPESSSLLDAESAIIAYVIVPNGGRNGNPQPIRGTRSGPSWAEMTTWCWGVNTLFEARRMRLYGGAVDSKDPSRFTIRYQAWGNTAWLEGHLDDQNRVTIEPASNF